MDITNTIRTYRNNVWITFDRRGDNFTMEVPHLPKWAALIRFLRFRGFKVGPNPSYEKHYKSLSTQHKLGRKGNVSFLLELEPGGIKIEFGNEKNRWQGIAQGFFNNPGDERHAPLNYLEGIAVRLEIMRTIEFAEGWGLETKKEESKMGPVEYILNTNRNNPHIHGKGISCLEDIAKSMHPDSYNYKHNSTDANGKQILCGETKCFWDHGTKRVFQGVVWHNINNMWWVVCNGNLHNVAAFDLFDYNGSLPRRRPVNAARIEKLLGRHSSRKDYVKCDHILRYAKRVGISV